MGHTTTTIDKPINLPNKAPSDKAANSFSAKESGNTASTDANASGKDDKTKTASPLTQPPGSISHAKFSGGIPGAGGSSSSPGLIPSASFSLGSFGASFLDTRGASIISVAG